ncbi:hypothetical protein [Parasphingorhabdus sp.]|uniref:hypothetical protein n=1 Tax=Parasphingorhabdus sp. TaxID=2709688 RepID=UPI0030028146
MTNNLFNRDDKPCPNRLIEDYSRAVMASNLAFKPVTKTTANTRQSILAGLIITDHRIDMSMREKVATAHSKVVGNDDPMRQLRTVAA